MESSRADHPLPDVDGNYDSRALRALSKVWEDYCEDLATPENVLGVIQEIGMFSQAQLHGLEQQIEQGVSDPNNESFSLIFEAFEMILEACELMILEFSDELPEGMEEPEAGFFANGFQLVQEATNLMMEGHLKGMDHLDSISKVDCPFCSQSNSREEPRCTKCGRTLAPTHQTGGGLDLRESQGLDPSRPQEQAETTKNYATAHGILEGWKAGAVSPEQLSDFLHHLQESFSGHLKDTERQAGQVTLAPASQRDGLVRALDKTRAGLEMSLEAVDKMCQAFERQDDRYLFFGLADLEVASKVLLEAYWDNKAASKKP